MPNPNQQPKRRRREKRRMAALLDNRPLRRYHRIHAGQEFFRPADPSDRASVPSLPVTAISRVEIQGSFKSYSNGEWNVKCFCGAMYVTRTSLLHQLSPASLHCPSCTLPRKRRSQTFRTRPGAERHIGETYGRLKVMEWLEREGWMCECKCGTLELVKRSVDLGSQGLKRCPHI